MMNITAITLLAVAVTLIYAWRRGRRHASQEPVNLSSTISDLKQLQPHHVLRDQFLSMVEEDGAGSWPPAARHGNWPPSLGAYKTVYDEVSPFLATSEPSLDDGFNIKRCVEFRLRMRSSLAKHVDADAAARCLQSMLGGDCTELGRDGFNGFYSCVACLRHAYRWATNPVVRVAQNEKRLAFPSELDLAWSFIQKKLDISSPSGNIMANIICNFDSHGHLTYLVNQGMSDAVLQTELAWCKLFTESETLATPMYCCIIQAMISYELGDKRSALSYTEAVFEHVRKLMLHLYNNMNDPNVSRAIWVRHVSGIHSWGLTSDSEHGPVEYGGLSGSQTLIFLAIDAFLGIDSYHSDEKVKMHISKNMRNVSAAMEKYCFRPQLAKNGSAEDLAISEVMGRIVKQMRTFRGVHKVRAVRFLSAPAPERVPMTAALSVLDEQPEVTTQTVSNEDLYASIDGILTTRLNLTV
ncbi:hypothetical protein PWT90_04926 [Aphanocladium album]|nr:hypothetical protein PWT90_04926 [Aphanocladium album]